MFAIQNGYFKIAHFLEKYIDPNSSSCKILLQSINQPIESTSSVIMGIVQLLKIQRKKELWNNKSTILEPKQTQQNITQLPLSILRKKLKKTQRKDNVTTNNIANK